MTAEIDRLFKTFLAPEVTSLVITRHGPSGAINVSPTDWVHKVAYKPPTLAVCKKHQTDTRSNLSKVGSLFVVAVPDADYAQDVLLCSKPVPPDQSELKIDGVRFEVQEETGDVVFLANMVWQAVCEVHRWIDFESHRMFLCEVHELRCDPDRAGKRELMHVSFKTFCRPGPTFDEKGW